ncbi:MAG: signal peptidase II [Clostridia bacterium]|nr:signal peptidase II [Clostridia bacterium]
MLEKIKEKLKFNVGLKSAILIAVGVALVLVDLLTKIFEERDGWNFTVIPKLIEVESGTRNPGCAFSFLADAAWGQVFLIVMTFILLIVLVAVFIFLPEKHFVLKISLCLITAGAVGNLIDRIAYREVRDFVNVNIFGSMAACNFADFWIVFGSILAVIDLLFIDEWSLFPLTKRAKEAQAKRKAEKDGAPVSTTAADDKNNEAANTETGADEKKPQNEEKTDGGENG